MTSTSPQTRSPLLRALCACIAMALTSPTARAQEDVPARVQRRHALRGAAMVQSGGLLGGQLGDAFAGITYAHQASELVALELTGGAGPAGARRGEHAGAGVRLSLVGRNAHALTAGLGGHVAFLPGYGNVGFGHLELAWELRARSGFNLVLGGGVGVTMTTSRRVVRDCTWALIDCTDERFEAGDSGLWSRLELGWAF